MANFFLVWSWKKSNKENRETESGSSPLSTLNPFIPTRPSCSMLLFMCAFFFFLTAPETYFLALFLTTDTLSSLDLTTGTPGGSDGEETACNTGDLGSIPGSGRSPKEGNGNPFLYSCLENSIDREAWWATQSIGSQRVRHDWVTKLTFSLALYYSKFSEQVTTLLNS